MENAFYRAGAGLSDILFVIFCHAVGKAELGLQQAEREERAQRWLDAQSLHWESDR